MRWKNRLPVRDRWPVDRWAESPSSIGCCGVRRRPSSCRRSLLILPAEAQAGRLQGRHCPAASRCSRANSPIGSPVCAIAWNDFQPKAWSICGSIVPLLDPCLVDRLVSSVGLGRGSRLCDVPIGSAARREPFADTLAGPVGTVCRILPRRRVTKAEYRDPAGRAATRFLGLHLGTSRRIRAALRLRCRASWIAMTCGFRCDTRMIGIMPNRLSMPWATTIWIGSGLSRLLQRQPSLRQRMADLNQADLKTRPR